MAIHQSNDRKAVLHRMVMPGHTCPYGLKAKDLLKRSGYEVEDHSKPSLARFSILSFPRPRVFACSVAVQGTEKNYPGTRRTPSRNIH